MGVNLNVRVINHSSDVRQAMARGIPAALTAVGIAAKQNIQAVVIEKDVYDTGELHRTMDYNVRDADKSVDMGSPKFYAVFNELGTSRMGARPFIRPGIFDNIEQYKEIITDTLQQALE